MLSVSVPVCSCALGKSDREIDCVTEEGYQWWSFKRAAAAAALAADVIIQKLTFTLNGATLLLLLHRLLLHKDCAFSAFQRR